MFVKFKCDCVVDTNNNPTLLIRCQTHGEEIKDWSSDYQSPMRVVIHWRDGQARFALHNVTYDQHGFPATVTEAPLTMTYQTTADLAQEARRLGLNMDEVSNIFYDRYLEYKEFFSEIESHSTLE